MGWVASTVVCVAARLFCLPLTEGQTQLLFSNMAKQWERERGTKKQHMDMYIDYTAVPVVCEKKVHI